MGMYFDRGVEYYVMTRRGPQRPPAILTLVTTRQSDDRLLASRYYAARKDVWFDPLKTGYDRIDADDFDVALSEREARTLQQYLDKFGDEVEDHGWYDVASMSTTYELPTGSGPRTHQGLEYCVELRDGKLMTVVASHEHRHGNYLLPGFVDDADELRLTGKQLELLESMLRVHDVVRHGWYNRV